MPIPRPPNPTHTRRFVDFRTPYGTKDADVPTPASEQLLTDPLASPGRRRPKRGNPRTRRSGSWRATASSCAPARCSRCAPAPPPAPTPRRLSLPCHEHITHEGRAATSAGARPPRRMPRWRDKQGGARGLCRASRWVFFWSVVRCKAHMAAGALRTAVALAAAMQAAASIASAGPRARAGGPGEDRVWLGLGYMDSALG